MRLSSNCRYVIVAGVTSEEAVDTVADVDVAVLVDGATAPKEGTDDVVAAGAEVVGAANENELVDGTAVVLVVSDGVVEAAVLVVKENPVDGAIAEVVLVEKEKDNGALVEDVAVEAGAEVTVGVENKLDDVLVEAPNGGGATDALVVVVVDVVAGAANENPELEGAAVDIVGAADVRLNESPLEVAAGVVVLPKENPVDRAGAADVTAVVVVAAGPKEKPVETGAAGAVELKLKPVEGAAAELVAAGPNNPVEAGAAGV